MGQAAAQEWLDARPEDQLSEGEAERLARLSRSKDPFVGPDEDAAADSSAPEWDDEVPF